MTTHLPFHQKLQPLPPLESGDRLTRPEFERRYAAATHIKKAELIEGVVYVASLLRHDTAWQTPQSSHDLARVLSSNDSWC